MVLVIRGETPSKKNSRINTRSGRSFPSKRYTEWLNSALAQVIEQTAEAYARGSTLRFEKSSRLSLTVTFYHGDLRRRDSDNQLSSILDMLVDAQVLADDDWTTLPAKFVFDVYDKGNPRCVICLEPIKEEALFSRIVSKILSFFRPCE